MCVVLLCCCCVHPGGADLFSPASLADPPLPSLSAGGERWPSGFWGEAGIRGWGADSAVLFISWRCHPWHLHLCASVRACVSCIDHLGIDPDSPKSSDFSMESGLVTDPGLILVCSVQTNVTHESMKLTECLLLIDQESTQILMSDHLVQRGFTFALGLLVRNKIFSKSDTLWTW